MKQQGERIEKVKGYGAEGFMVALLIKLENDNTCPMCGRQGRVKEADKCPMCKAILLERTRIMNTCPAEWE